METEEVFLLLKQAALSMLSKGLHNISETMNLDFIVTIDQSPILGTPLWKIGNNVL